MKGSEKVVAALNGLLALELTAVYQYFAHAKMCENWGYQALAAHLRQTSLEEMKDAEEIMDRILFLDGIPRMQQDQVVVGTSVPDLIKMALDLELRALSLLRDGIAVAVEEGDQASREFFAARLADEEQHVDWAETQLSLISHLGESDYLAQQLRA
jgi:bacterioferritin